jgi:hypothetical protein
LTVIDKTAYSFNQDGTKSQPISVPAGTSATVLNAGAGTVYYKATPDVTSASSDGTITTGASTTFTATKYVISAQGASNLLFVETTEGATEDFRVGDDLTIVDDTTFTDTITTTGGVAGGVPRNVNTWQAPTATSGTDTACSNGTAYVGSVFLPMNATVTGIQFLVGSVGGTNNVHAALHSIAGAPLANSAAAGAVVGTAAQVQQVAFTATYAAVGPAFYFVALTFNGTTAKFRSVPAHTQNGVIGNGVTQTFGTIAAFTPPTTFTADKVPVASLY